VFTWLGKEIPQRLRSFRSSHTSVAGVLDEQAQRHGAQVFAAEADRQTVRGRVVFRCKCCVDARVWARAPERPTNRSVMPP